ncbi:GSCOCG00008391001-RA-CDS, partial [Cotesia congregata]
PQSLIPKDANLLCECIFQSLLCNHGIFLLIRDFGAKVSLWLDIQSKNQLLLLYRSLVLSTDRGSPVSLDNVLNSSKNVPIPAVHVMVVSPLGTPYFKFTVP